MANNKDNEKKGELSVIETSNLADLSLGELRKVGLDLMKSSIVAHDNVEDVIAAVMISKEIGISPMAGLLMGKKLNKQAIAKVIKGKKLGLDPITAIENLHYINDNSSSTGIHILTGIALKAGVTFKILKDYVPVYGYLTKEKVVVKKDELDLEIFQVVKGLTKEQIDSTKIGVIPYSKPVDRVTEIEYCRTIGDKELKVVITTYYSEFAHLQDKDNWKNYPKVMLRNRNQSIGFRAVANDHINGLYENTEILDTTDREYNINEHGETTFVDAEVVD